MNILQYEDIYNIQNRHKNLFGNIIIQNLKGPKVEVGSDRWLVNNVEDIKLVSCYPLEMFKSTEKDLMN